MARYGTQTLTRDGETVLAMRDTGGVAEALIWPGCGNNCFSLTLPDPAGRPVTVVQAPPALAEIRRRPSWWGIPLLFPFPGTIPGGEYRFEGRSLRLGRPDQPVVSEGHEFPGARRDYHGFVMDLPWEVGAVTADDGGATVQASVDATAHPHVLEGFPFPFRVGATYRLDGRGLHLTFSAENTGTGRLPFGFGAHPFFRVPLGDAGTAGECLICIPAARRWDGRRVRGLLRGETTATVTEDEIRPPVSPDLDLRTPRPFVERVYNGMYCDLTLVDGGVEAFVRDPASGLEAVMRAAPELPNVVFWSPPGRSELCFEPWSCPSNVFNLAAHGVPHHGLLVLEPGETWQTTMSISLRAAPSGT